jgi:hypothetical protein
LSAVFFSSIRVFHFSFAFSFAFSAIFFSSVRAPLFSFHFSLSAVFFSAALLAPRFSLGRAGGASGLLLVTPRHLGVLEASSSVLR